LVAGGTYTGLGNRDIHFRGHDIVVRSEAGPDFTTIDVQASRSDPHRGFLIDGQLSPAAVLDGFTIVNGYMGLAPGRPVPKVRPGLPQPEHDLSAGGVKCQDSAPTLRNLVIRNCGSEYTGGGMSVELLAEPTIVSVMIQGCSAGFFGGGISIETHSRAHLTNCVFTGNHADRGGGFACNAEATFEGCLVSGNEANAEGGGVMIIYPGITTLERTIVWGNCGDDGYGEVCVDNEASITFACSVVDPGRIVKLGTGNATFSGTNVSTAPHFCYPLACTSAPTLAATTICKRCRRRCRTRARAASASGRTMRPVRRRRRSRSCRGRASRRCIATRHPDGAGWGITWVAARRHRPPTPDRTPPARSQRSTNASSSRRARRIRAMRASCRRRPVSASAISAAANPSFTRRCATTSPHRCSWIAPRTPCARSSMVRACAAICTPCRCRGPASTASSASASCITCRSAPRYGARSPGCCAREAGWCSAFYAPGSLQARLRRLYEANASTAWRGLVFRATETLVGLRYVRPRQSARRGAASHPRLPRGAVRPVHPALGLRTRGSGRRLRRVEATRLAGMNILVFERA
jgi:hypothetical protein